VAGGVALSGCGGGSGSQEDAGACTEVKDDAGAIVSCTPVYSCELDTVNNKCVVRQAPSDATVGDDAEVADGPVDMDGGVPDAEPQMDAGVQDDAGVQEDASTQSDGGVQNDASVPACNPTWVENAQVQVTRNAGLGSYVDGSGSPVKCGQTLCEGTVEVSEVILMNTATYTVDSITDTSLEAVSGTSKIVAVSATSGSGASCTAYHSGVELGSCTDILNSSVEYVAPFGWDNTDAAGRATISVSVSSTLDVGPLTKQMVLSDGEAKTVTFTTAVYDLTVDAYLVRGTDGKAFVRLVVSDANTSDVFKQPLGMAMDEGVIAQLGPVYLRADASSDNVQILCTATTAKFTVDGSGKEYKDGETANVGGKQYKVNIQLRTDDTGVMDTAKTHVSLVDVTAPKNKDHVFVTNDTKTVNGSTVVLTEVTATATGNW